MNQEGAKEVLGLWTSATEGANACVHCSAPDRAASRPILHSETSFDHRLKPKSPDHRMQEMLEKVHKVLLKILGEQEEVKNESED